MKRLLAVCGILLCGSAAMAQSNRFTLSVLQPKFSSVSATAEGENVPVRMTSRTGFALHAAHEIGRMSFGFSAARFSAPVSATLGQQDVGMGSLTLTPISATVAFHAGNGRVDPYIGGGVAWVMTSNLRSDGLNAVGLDSVSIGDDFTYVVNAGVNIPVTSALVVNLDARYMPVSVSAHAVDAPPAEMKFKTTTIGVGLQWKF
jgi:opacity protein-like surface antigen